MAGRPSYTREAQKEITAQKKRLEGDVQAIAERLASHAGCEKVLAQHAQQAFDALARVGLRKHRFYSRVEFEVGVGALLVGIALAMPDYLPYVTGFLPTGTETFESVLLGVSSPILILSGLGLSIHGWMRGSV
jgi:hypothetical protein